MHAGLKIHKKAILVSVNNFLTSPSAGLIFYSEAAGSEQRAADTGQRAAGSGQRALL